MYNWIINGLQWIINPYKWNLYMLRYWFTVYMGDCKVVPQIELVIPLVKGKKLLRRMVSSSKGSSVIDDIWLVVSTPLKNMKVSWGYYSQYMEEKKYSKPPTRYPLVMTNIAMV